MTGLSPRDVLRILRADPGACAEAFRVCAGTLRQRGAVIGLRDGLVLRAADNGPWQQFYPQPDGTLKNAATGLIVSPNGTGAQFRGARRRAPGVGSACTWMATPACPGERGRTPREITAYPAQIWQA
jgi:hypothetical protein